MIRLILKGGLGNQMFQYATAYSLAKELDTEVLIDLSFMKNRLPVPGFTQRNYQLDLFDLDVNTTSLFKNKFLNNYFAYPVEKALLASGIWGSYIEKDPYVFDKDFFDLEDGSVIEGYFNNYKYFEKYKEEVVDIFNTDNLYDNQFDEIENKIKNTQSVSVNIRRGDYTNKKHRDVFVQLDKSYYSKAIDIIRSEVENPHFYVFSIDDPTWFKEVLDLKEGEYTYMGSQYIGERFGTYFKLISLCNHNIISNSTFAFWAAYLNKNTGKVVVTPNQWAKIWSKFNNPRDWKSI